MGSKRDDAERSTLGETARLTGIPTQTLRRACDEGRLPHTRDPRGFRRIPSDAVDRLRRRGLEAFPRPDAIDGDQPARQSAPERLGLLGTPSPELQHTKEQLEATKMALEREKVDWELEQLRRARQADEENARAAEATELEAQRQTQERAKQQQLRRDQEARRQAWLQQYREQAWGKLRSKAFWVRPNPLEQDRDELAIDFETHFARAFANLTPASSWGEVYDACEYTVEAVLAPYRKRQNQDKTIKSALGSIAHYLRELCTHGWLDCKDPDFLARQLEPSMREILEREVRARDLDDQKAKELLQEAIEARLKIF